MWQNALHDLIRKHLPLWVYVTIAIGGATTYVVDQMNEGISNFESQVIAKATAPYYLSVEYSLEKQLEKIRKDPDDLKEADIEYLYIHCNDDFGNIYLDKLPPNRNADAKTACMEIARLYTNRTH